MSAAIRMASALPHLVGAIDWIPVDATVMSISAALLTPLVAGIAVYVAVRQASTARNKLKLDLFDRRMQVYESAFTLIGATVDSGYLGPDAANAFLRGTAPVRWLFGAEVEQFLSKELWPIISRIAVHQAQVREMSIEEQGWARKHLGAAVELLARQSEPLAQVFRKYLGNL